VRKGLLNSRQKEPGVSVEDASFSLTGAMQDLSAGLQSSVVFAVR
jgi:hypothetical protein